MNLKCPRCAVGKLMETGVRLYTVSARGPIKAEPPKNIVVDQCSLCGGVWFDKKELFEYLKLGLTSLVSGIPLESSEEQVSLVTCPKCLSDLKHRKDQDVSLWYCFSCQGIWVEGVELTRLERVRRRSVMNFIFSLIPKRFLWGNK